MPRTLRLPVLLALSLAACADHATESTSTDDLRALSTQEALDAMASRLNELIAAAATE